MQYVQGQGIYKELAQKEVKEYTNEKISEIIDNYIHSKRDRLVLKRRYIDGILIEPLAEEFDLSVSTVKRIIYKHENTIFKRL